MTDLRIPQWVRVPNATFKSIDLGVKYAPLTQSEKESSLLIRGPVVIAATAQTKPESKKLFPQVMTNVRFMNSGGQFYIQFVGTPYRIREIEITSRVVPTIGGILIETRQDGQLKIRKMLNGDISLFTFAPGASESNVADFMGEFWKGLK